MTSLEEALRVKYDVEWDLVLGKGNDGKLMAGVHRPSSDRVAIKCMNENEDGLREIDMLAMLGTHPHVLPMWDHVLVDSGIAIVFPREACDLLSYSEH